MTTRSDLQLNFGYANNDLVGNGSGPRELAGPDRRAVYTFPDQTKNLMYLGNLRGSHWLTDDLLLSGNAFYRYYQRNTQNGDAEVACVDDDHRRGGLRSPMGRVLPLGLCQGSAAGFFDASGTPLTGELEREAEAERRTTETITQDWGTTLQLSYKGKIFGRGNKVTLGVAYDGHSRPSPSARPRRSSFPHGNSTGVRAHRAPRDRSGRPHPAAERRHLSPRYPRPHRPASPHLRRAIPVREHHDPRPHRRESRARWRPQLQPHQPSRGLDATSPLSGPGLLLLLQRGVSRAHRRRSSRAPTRMPRATSPTPSSPIRRSTRSWAAPTSSARAGSCPWATGSSGARALFRTDVQDDILFTVVEAGGGRLLPERRQDAPPGGRGRPPGSVEAPDGTSSATPSSMRPIRPM